MSACPSALTLKWHNIVNSQYIAFSIEEYGTFGQIRAIKGKYDQIMVINATLGQIYRQIVIHVDK